jgi:hypothetical protein
METSSPRSTAIAVTFFRVDYKWKYFKITVLCNEALCGLVEIYRLLEERADTPFQQGRYDSFSKL